MKKTTIFLITTLLAIITASAAHAQIKYAADAETEAEIQSWTGASVFIATLPPKADVYIDGKLMGTSNGGDLEVPVGTYRVKFVKDGFEWTEKLTFNPGKNATLFINLKRQD